MKPDRLIETEMKYCDFNPSVNAGRDLFCVQNNLQPIISLTMQLFCKRLSDM